MKGLLLVNLGTPDAPQTRPVRRYLRQFLGDPRVIDLNPVGRWLLLQLIILPFRPKRSAAAYRKIWTERGSPLLFHGEDLTQAVAAELRSEFAVELAMRYGTPSIEYGLQRLKERGVQALTVLPLYPQYATSSTESVHDEVKAVLARAWPDAEVQWVPAFYAFAPFLDAFAAVARPVLESMRPDHLLFSFHGLPQNQVTDLDATGEHCLKRPDCCDAISAVNANCYRAQCYFTARALAERLGLPQARYSVGFQSRLTSKWIQPFSDVLLQELPKQGVKRLAVMCPAFVADCLETLEEVGLRAKDSFLAAGGEALELVPSLNASPAWVKAVAELARGRR